MFKDVKNHEHYYKVKENGTYGIGIYPVMYGFRVRVWKLGAQTCINDLCFGANPHMVSLGYTVILDYLSEGGDPNEIPFQATKPYPNKCEFQKWMDNYLVNNYFGNNDMVSITALDLHLIKHKELSKYGL